MAINENEVEIYEVKYSLENIKDVKKVYDINFNNEIDLFLKKYNLNKNQIITFTNKDKGIIRYILQTNNNFNIEEFLLICKKNIERTKKKLYYSNCKDKGCFDVNYISGIEIILIHK